MVPLEGKKTYVLAGCGLAVVGAYLAGWVSETVADALLAAFGFGSIAALRARLGQRPPPPPDPQKGP